MVENSAHLSILPEPDGYWTGPRRLLVVEDEEPCRTALTRLLLRKGYSVWCVASAEEALAALGGDVLPTDMVIDVDLPGINGMELAMQVRMLNPRIQSIMVTAADRGMVQAFCDANAMDYFPKPLDVPRFLEHIASARHA